MRIGQGQFDDWRVVGAVELRDLLHADRITLSCFIPSAREAERYIALLRGDVFPDPKLEPGAYGLDRE